MRIQVSMAALAAAALAAGAAQAQAPAAGPPKLQVEKPNYVTIPMEIMVNKPAKEVWARIGKYCDIAEWFQIPGGCTIINGKPSEEIGAQRSVAREVMVAKTELSYGYTQPVYEGRVYNLYHGFLEARPVTARTTKILYTLLYDNSMVPGDDAAKAAEMQRRRTQFERGLANMKILAEGGTLPPPPARPAPPAAPAPK